MAAGGGLKPAGGDTEATSRSPEATVWPWEPTGYVVGGVRDDGGWWCHGGGCAEHVRWHAQRGAGGLVRGAAPGLRARNRT